MTGIPQEALPGNAGRSFGSPLPPVWRASADARKQDEGGGGREDGGRGVERGGADAKGE